MSESDPKLIYVVQHQTTILREKVPIPSMKGYCYRKGFIFLRMDCLAQIWGTGQVVINKGSLPQLALMCIKDLGDAGEHLCRSTKDYQCPLF